METNKILTANILDILFEGRNKEYGAYDLRKTYNKRINAALGVTAVATMIFIGTFTGKNVNETRSIKPPIVDVSLTKPEIEKPKIFLLPKKLIKAEPIKTRIYTSPIIVADKNVMVD